MNLTPSIEPTKAGKKGTYAQAAASFFIATVGIPIKGTTFHPAKVPEEKMVGPGPKAKINNQRLRDGLDFFGRKRL